MSDNRTTELLPCPFCGGEAKMTKINHATWVECSNYHYERHQVSVHAKTEAEAIAAWNTRATASGGTLTAEQVRDAVERHWHDLSADYDMPETAALPEFSYDWQAIADELNAIGGGECELEEVDVYSNACETIHVLECSKCGETCEHVNGIYPRCPHCGRRVKR